MAAMDTSERRPPTPVVLLLGSGVVVLLVVPLWGVVGFRNWAPFVMVYGVLGVVGLSVWARRRAAVGREGWPS